MDKYTVIAPKSRGDFQERLAELKTTLGEYLAKEKEEKRNLQYNKIFLSDAQNQYQALVESELYQKTLVKTASSIIEQAPVDGSKISLLIKTSDEPNPFEFQALRLTDEEAKGQSSYLQTMLLFQRYLKTIENRGISMKEHLIRTWIYVADIDINYDGVVRARNDIFKRYGLTFDTHFIASTGIGGWSQTCHATVAMDFLTCPKIKESDKQYLKALEYLNPTHEYGVAFERGTRVQLDNKQMYFISGTASIDKFGHVIYLGDVAKQTERLLENIDALLKDGNATIDDVKYFIIYLRDLSDYTLVNEYMKKRFPETPFIITLAKVCRPQWLIEMECIAEK